VGASPAAVHDASARRVAAASLRRNVNLPPHVMDLLQKSRAARTLYLRAAGIARAAEPPANSELACAAAKLLANVAAKLADKELRRLRRWNLSKRRDELATIRLLDGHAFNREIGKLADASEGIYVGTDGVQPIPDELGHPPAGPRFAADFTARVSVPVAPAPGATDPNWLAHVPVAPEPALAHAVTADELMGPLFPFSPATCRACPASGLRDGSCPQCRDLDGAAGEWEGPNDLLHETPASTPSGNTAAAVFGNLSLKYIRWARPRDGSRLAYRREICGYFAAVLNRALAEGRMPLGSTRYRVVPIPKDVKPGAVVNKADPADAYRYITMSGLFAKVAGLAIAARLTHWAIARGVLSPSSQGAFTPMMSTEWHPWALLESIREEWKQNRSVLLLLVDFRKAYDSVTPAALFAVLRKMGVAEALVKLLEAWSASRVGSLDINGVTVTADTPMLSGVGQGDVASCILFNLFIESLGRYLKAAAPGARVGVTPAGCSIDVLKFADDVAALHNLLDPLRATVLAVERWAAAWGMTLNLGPNKTAVMEFLHPAARRARRAEDSRRRRTGRPAFAQPAVTLSTGAAVPWTSSYRYLGYDLRDDLKDSGVVAATVATMKYHFQRVFWYNSIVWRSSQTLQFQVLKTYVVGAVNYLNGLVEPTARNLKAVDSVLAKAARAILGLPRSSPSILYRLEMNAPSALFLYVRARIQLLLSLLHTPHDDAPAPALLGALVQQIVPGAPLDAAGPGASWLQRTKALVDEWAARGAVISDVTSRRDVGRAAFVFARLLTNIAILESATADGVPTDRTLLSHRVHGAPPKAAVMSNVLGLRWTIAGMGDLRVTPLSVLGAYCAGSGFALTRRAMPRDDALAWARSRLGAYALHIPPLAPKTWTVSEQSGGDAMRDASRGQRCPFCLPTPASPVADIMHVLCECTHPAVAAARAVLQRAAADFVCRLAERVATAQRGFSPALELEVADALAALRVALPLHDWNTPSGASLLYRLLLVLPFPAACVDDAAAGVARALGRAFDATIVPVFRRHALFDSWGAWAIPSLRRMVAVWADAVDVAAAAVPG